VIVDGKVVIAVLNAGQGLLVALDLPSGEVVWKTDRTYETPEESDQAYTTPCVMTHDGRQVIVTAGADHVTGHDARTGELLWECGGMNPGEEGMQRMIASPAPARDAVIVPYGRGGKLLKVRLGGRGDVTDTHTLWNEILEVGDVPTPLVHRDQVLILSDTGHISLLDLATSAPIWISDLPKSRNKYYASPVLAGNTLYFTREDGMLFSCELSEEGLRIVAENELGDQLLATPVPLRGKLLVRGSEHLYLFR
ncbi:MAG: PQQ-like beta-propeller repeat protein, partial [Pirellulales bacterium]|nr:PQQ-like beta-propeller repeat protein [Pirellulales bacterium]